MNQANQRIEKFLASLDWSHYSQIVGGCFPPLVNVSQREAEDWARREETRRVCPLDTLLVGIRTAFENWQNVHDQKSMPMEFLASELAVLIAQ
jgi:hypothetical protein